MSIDKKKINFTDYAVKMTPLNNVKIIHETEKAILLSFLYNGVTIQHWFPKSLTQYDNNEVKLVPLFVYEEALKNINGLSQGDSIKMSETNTIDPESLDNKKLINRVVGYLIREQIQSILDELPDMPNFSNTDSYTAQLWGQSQSGQISRIETRKESVEKILKHGASVIGDISMDKGGYHQYVTSRIHEFADNWLANEDKKNLELKIISDKRARNTYVNERKYGDERFQDDEYEWATNGIEEQQLEELGIDEWDKLVEIVRSIKNYAFQSDSNNYKGK